MMLLWIVGLIGLCVLLGMVAILAACLVLEAYRARLELQRDLIAEVTKRKWSLIWERTGEEWVVCQFSEIAFHDTTSELGRHRRWEIAIQDALATVQQPEQTVDR